MGWWHGHTGVEKSIYAANQAIVSTKKEYLEDNIDIQLTKEYAEVQKLKQLLDKDEQIIQLQGEIVESAFSQVKNGLDKFIQFELVCLCHMFYGESFCIQ